MKLVIIAHNVRSTHNVGSILRSADGFGVDHIYFSGYTPYPAKGNDERLPHLKDKIDRQIHKTALGAEKTVAWDYNKEIKPLITNLRADGFLIAALEQTDKARSLDEFRPNQDVALIVGNEVDGIDQQILEWADIHLEIPMAGKKESFNVAVAASIAMYELKIHA
jgi:23S rRNA (guanosine2251-2'-O)-methyltransferase